jgi:hypothetical protein
MGVVSFVVVFPKPERYFPRNRIGNSIGDWNET